MQMIHYLRVAKATTCAAYFMADQPEAFAYRGIGRYFAKLVF